MTGKATQFCRAGMKLNGGDLGGWHIGSRWQGDQPRSRSSVQWLLSGVPGFISCGALIFTSVKWVY